MLTGHDLTGQQRMLVHEAACRSDRVVCVVGVAGSGKTLALRALADAYRGIAATVLGAAPSGRAADELETATGITSRTLHRLLLDAERDGGLPRGCVLVVDEAGMAETRVLAPLLQAIDKAEGKLLLVGDPAQLPAVGAGGLYPALCHRLGALELTQNRRQRDPLEREALARLRAGDPEPYLAHAARHGRFSVDDDATTAKERLLGDWWREARRSPARNVMLAYHRSDVDELNQAAHALMLRHRRLGRTAVTLGEREFRVSDQILCRRNDDRLGLRNGMRGTDLLERETPLREPDPASAPERAARALQRSSVEPVALDQRRQRPDTILNFYTQQQEKLDRHRERTAEQLATAQCQLQHLHWWSRDRRAELETEIALHHGALERADAKQEQLRQLAERRSRMLALASERDKHASSLRPEPARRSPAIKLERDPPGLGLEL